MAILSVVIMSFVVVTTLTTVYIYLVNRAKYHSRIREAYQLTHVMEEFGKLTRQAYDTASSISGDICPGGQNRTYTAANNITGMNMCFPPCASAKTEEAAEACVPEIGNMCISHLGKDYCLESTPLVGDSGTVSTEQGVSNIAKLRIRIPTANPENPTLARWYARLDKFFDSAAEPIEIASREHLGPALNTKIPVPSAFKWIERETYALAQDQVAGTNHSTSTTLETHEAGEPEVRLPKEYKSKYAGQQTPDDDLKSDTCDNASSSLPTCQPPKTEEPPRRIYESNVPGSNTPEGPSPQQTEIPKICTEGAATPDGRSTRAGTSHGGGSIVPPRVPVIPECLAYCEINHNLPSCQGGSATIQAVTCPGGPNCQTCTAGSCLELGYCLDGMECKEGDDGQYFKQSVRLIL